MAPRNSPFWPPSEAPLDTQWSLSGGHVPKAVNFFFGADFKTKRLKSQKKFSEKFQNENANDKI